MKAVNILLTKTALGSFGCAKRMAHKTWDRPALSGALRAVSKTGSLYQDVSLQVASMQSQFVRVDPAAWPVTLITAADDVRPCRRL